MADDKELDILDNLDNIKDKQNKVFKHPESKEIISKLVAGESVKSVEAWLKQKHPKKKILWITSTTLQKFRKEHLHLEGEALENIKNAKREMLEENNLLEAKKVLNSSNAYQDKIKEITNAKLDADKKLVEMIALVSSRIEHYFNVLQVNGTSKEDRIFIEYINTLRGLFQDYKKYIDGFADQKIDHNINITVVNEQITVLKNIMFEILQELDPSVIPIFVEKINARLLDVQHGSNNYENYYKNQPLELDIIDAEYE